MAAAIGAIAGAAIGGGSQGMASAAQYQASKHERNIAWKRQQAWELMAPSLRVAGLRQAGLNPILAATNGMGQGATNVNMADTGGTPHFDTDSVGKVISSVRQARMMGQQFENLRQEGEILRQKALQEDQLTAQAVEDTKIKQQFGLAMARAEYQAGVETVLNLAAERGLASARTQESEQAKMRMYTDRLLMEMGVPGARAMEALYEKHPWLRQVREFSSGGLIQTGVGLGSAATAAGAGYLFGQRKDRNVDFGHLKPGGFGPVKRGEPAGGRKKR